MPSGQPTSPIDITMGSHQQPRYVTTPSRASGISVPMSSASAGSPVQVANSSPMYHAQNGRSEPVSPSRRLAQMLFSDDDDDDDNVTGGGGDGGDGGKDDDFGPKYAGGSSEADDINFLKSRSIKPSNFVRPSEAKSTGTPEKVPETPSDGGSRFKHITSSAVFDANSAYNNNKNDHNEERGKKRFGSHVAKPTAKRLREDDSVLEGIKDFQMRINIKRILAVLPKSSVQTCYDALVAKRGNFEDALEYVPSLEEEEAKKHRQTPQEQKQTPRNSQNEPQFDDDISDDELLDAFEPENTIPAKQQIKAHARIQDRWAATQKPVNISNREESKTGPRSVISPEKASSPPKSSRKQRPIDNDQEPVILSDSEVEAQSEQDTDLEGKVLKFFNECSVPDLSDIAEISGELSQLITSKRPFKSLDSVRNITDEQTASTAKTKGKKLTKRPIGDKIVDKCLDMWTGYEAVDALVTKCESLGSGVAAEMKKWGIDIFGQKTAGELEMVSLKEKTESSQDDSADTEEDQQQLLEQPAVMSDTIKMKDYQIVGLNWLSLLFREKLSCILADDMGLGKTCQVISFLAHLHEKGVKGPHLVVVPSSTLENWLREFQTFCPRLSVMPYYAGQEARAGIREQIQDNMDDIDVIVTTYTIAKAKVDASFLRSMPFCVCIYDEGHMLKNSKSVMYGQLVRIPARFRLLLTGTPLQNNLQELVSLLGFILPSVFRERKDDLEYIFSAKAKTVDDSHANLLSAQRIARAKSMLTPFVLRRKKHQVIDLPPKITRVEWCQMNDTQREIYGAEVEAVRKLLLDRANGKKTGNKTANNLMRLRQAAIHPLFFRRIYDDKTLRRISKACLKDEQWRLSDPEQIYAELQPYNDFEVYTLCVNNPTTLSKFGLRNEEWMHSGKVERLCSLLKEFKANGDRTLIFSQFTMVMDILEHVLETLHMGFFRLDGGTSVEDRQAILDAFYEQIDIPVFLLSTKAGGAGINLACANKVIIFDSGFNPQDDVQAENRAHRVGQSREVEVVRLVTKGTIEEKIHTLGETKLALDQRVAGDSEESGAASKKSEVAGLEAVQDMMVADLQHVPNSAD